MIKFNEKDSISVVFNITDQQEADDWLSAYSTHIWLTNPEDISMEKAMKIAKGNIGYFGGYVDLSTAEKLENLFKCSHPILGTVAERSKLTTKEILQKGIDFAKQNELN